MGGIYVQQKGVLLGANIFETGFVQPVNSKDFFPRFGVKVMAAGVAPDFTLAHELGHVFGALHERQVVKEVEVSPTLYDTAKIESWSNFAYDVPDQFYGSARVRTVMYSTSWDARLLYFSTPAIKINGSLVIGDARSNNRRQIMTTLGWLSPGLNNDWLADPP